MDNAQTAVTQEDRDAAATWRRDWQWGSPETCDEIIAGKHDRWSVTQAFARHRIATTADLQARLEASEARVAVLVGALELARNRLQRCAIDPIVEGKPYAYEWSMWADDAAQALATTRNADAQGGGA